MEKNKIKNTMNAQNHELKSCNYHVKWKKTINPWKRNNKFAAQLQQYFQNE
jgi:hypothetical protein